VFFAEKPPWGEDIRYYAASGIGGIMLDTTYKSGPGLPALMNHAAKGVTDKDF